MGQIGQFGRLRQDQFKSRIGHRRLIRTRAPPRAERPVGPRQTEHEGALLAASHQRVENRLGFKHLGQMGQLGKGT